MNNVDKDKYLTEADIDRIAEKAASRAIEKVYAEVGRSFAKRFFYIMGVIGIGIAMWLAGTGNLPK